MHRADRCSGVSHGAVKPIRPGVSALFECGNKPLAVESETDAGVSIAVVRPERQMGPAAPSFAIEDVVRKLPVLGEASDLGVTPKVLVDLLPQLHVRIGSLVVRVHRHGWVQRS